MLDIEGSLRAKTELSMLYWRVGYRRQSEGQNKQSYQCYTGVLDIGEDSLRAKTELSMLYWRVGYRKRQPKQTELSMLLSFTDTNLKIKISTRL